MTSLPITTPSAAASAPLTTEDTVDPWRTFSGEDWKNSPAVRDFIVANYTPYLDDDAFLAGATARTTAIWKTVSDLMLEEHRRGGVLDIDTHTPSTITAHKPGYIDQSHELIVGLQTDAPLKRAIMPNGGLRMVEDALHAYGYAVDPAIHREFSVDRKTHNDGVFDAYTPAILAARRAAIITGLPDAYGRGRIIGDYRRVALYGVDALIAWRTADRHAIDHEFATEEVIRDREEMAEQIRALGELRTMAALYGYDISRPARTAREAIQWVYFAYLAATKEQNGAAMSIGRISTFLDIYIARDIAEGSLTETQAQELVDDFVIKLRMIRFLRTPAYDELFSGDPTWVTEAIGGIGCDGRPMVTKTSFRMLQTLHNLGPAPEPNLTVLWSSKLPRGFREFCARTSIATSSIQYENDELLRTSYGDDTSIACCVSGMETGRSMQFFGARANLAKALLYAINGGRDEVTGDVVIADLEPAPAGPLKYDDVMRRFDAVLDWLSETYVAALNIIHFMHDRYAYERLEMALHDPRPHRTLACGIAGLSVTADSLAAIRYARVTPQRNEAGIAIGFQTDGDFPTYGNNDEQVDSIAQMLVQTFMEKLRRHPAYRGAEHTQSVLTITSNVVYGKNTGATPDGRDAGEPFAPGANPMHGRDTHGLVASALSVAHLNYNDARDGISYTASITPSSLGRTAADRISNLVGVLDGYCASGGFHMNINVLDRETLLDAMEHPDEYPHLTIRVSGYAVKFTRLTREQQLDVVHRTFHESL